MSTPEELARLLLKPAAQQPPRMLQAVVSAVINHTLELLLPGNTVAIGGVRYLSSYVPEVADVVWVLKNGPDLLVIGSLSTEDRVSMDTLVPIGTIMPFSGATQPNSRYLFCDGSPVSRTTYLELFGLIGTTYGIGDGSTTFNLPDLRGRTPIGVGNGTGTNRTLAQKVGAEQHTLVTAEMPTHTHTQNAHNHTQAAHNHAPSTGGQFSTNVFPSTSSWSFVGPSGGNNQANGGTATASATPAINNATASNQNTGGGDPHNNMQPSLAVNFILRAL